MLDEHWVVDGLVIILSSVGPVEILRLKVGTSSSTDEVVVAFHPAVGTYFIARWVAFTVSRRVIRIFVGA